MYVDIVHGYTDTQRENDMTPKLGSALEALKKLKSFAEDEGEKLSRRITDEAEPMLIKAFKDAHCAIDGLHDGVKDITDFCDELKTVTSNGGGPLDQSPPPSTAPVPPRSSDLA
jgi:hypothetical protein